METKDLKERTAKLKTDITTLLIEYAKETNIAPEAVQAIVDPQSLVGPEPKYNIELGVRL